MPKRKYTKKSKKASKKKIKILNLILLMAFISIIASIIAYTILLKETSPNNIKISTNTNTNTNTNNDDEKELEEYRKERLNKYNDELFLNNKTSNETQLDNKTDIIQIVKEKIKEKDLPFVTIKKIKPPLLEKKETTIKNKKPQLVIIIDDVSSSFQVKKINALKHHITMSFLPPTSSHPNSAKITKNLDFYMIHLPLQAKKDFRFQEEKTLLIEDSYESIEKYIQKIRQWYPEGLYINNHTGSQFTSNDKAMNNLYKALKKYNFIFVDSRTTAKSLAKKYSHKYQMPLISRNIFLDNKQDFNYIQKQLKKAIHLAKKNGSAIAIGHPYDITMKVIKNSEHLFKDINLVYLNESLL